MSSDETRASFTCYYKSEKYAGSTGFGKCQPMVADSVDAQRRQHAGADANHHGKWSIMLTHVYMSNFRSSNSSCHSSYSGRLRTSTPKARAQSQQQTTQFKVDIFPSCLLKKTAQLVKMYEPSMFFFPSSAQSPLDSGPDKRVPEWHRVSLPRPESGEAKTQTVTVRVGNGGDTAGYGADGPYHGLQPLVKTLTKTLPAHCLWRLSFDMEIDDTNGGEPKLGQLAIITPSYLAKRTSEHFGDSIQIWVGVEGSDNMASLHYAFVDGKSHMGPKTKVSYHIMNVDRVEHLGDQQNGDVISSSYVVKLRAHLGPALLDEPTFVLPQPHGQDDDDSKRGSVDPEETGIVGDDSEANDGEQRGSQQASPQQASAHHRDSQQPSHRQASPGQASSPQASHRQASPEQSSIPQASHRRAGSQQAAHQGNAHEWNAAQPHAVGPGLAHADAYNQETIDPNDLHLRPTPHETLPRTDRVSNEPRGNPLQPTILSGNQLLGAAPGEYFAEALYMTEYAKEWEELHAQEWNGTTCTEGSEQDME